MRASAAAVGMSYGLGGSRREYLYHTLSGHSFVGQCELPTVPTSEYPCGSDRPATGRRRAASLINSAISYATTHLVQQEWRRERASEGAGGRLSWGLYGGKSSYVSVVSCSAGRTCSQPSAIHGTMAAVATAHALLTVGHCHGMEWHKEAAQRPAMCSSQPCGRTNAKLRRRSHQWDPPSKVRTGKRGRGHGQTGLRTRSTLLTAARAKASTGGAVPHRQAVVVRSERLDRCTRHCAVCCNGSDGAQLRMSADQCARNTARV